MTRSSASSPAPPPLRLRRRPFKTPAAGGRRTGPATPLLRWDAGGGGTPVAETARGASVRRLAAAVWRLRRPEAADGGAGRGEARARVGLEHIPRHLQVQLLKSNPLRQHHDMKNEISSPISVLEPKSGELHKVQLCGASAVFPITAMENATKWAPESVNGIESDGAYLIASQLNLIDKQHGANYRQPNAPYVANLQIELQQAHDRVSELESERRSAKKKIDHLFKKLVEEKAAWCNREHKKAQAILEDMKADVEHEKKNRRRLETINLKLVNELNEAKMSAQQLLQEYEKERKARELVEEVCSELVREVDEDKSEIEALKREFLKLREEMDEERNMLQMAEVWREERVQMKLVDAKLTLDAKYTQLSKLQQDVEAFIATFSWAKADSMVVREAEYIIQAIQSVREHEVVEFSYELPPASEDILSIFEELRPSEDHEIKEIGPCYTNIPAIHESRIQEISPTTDTFLEKSAKVYSNQSPCNESETKDASSWETISHEEMQGSSGSPDGSEYSVNEISDGAENCKLNDDLTNVYLTDMKPPKKKESAILKLWRSSRLRNGETCKRDVVETMKGTSLNARLSNGMQSTTDTGIQGMGFSPPSIRRRSLPESMNIQLNGGFGDCIEYPRTAHKQSLKGKLLEARTESQKVQLRHVLSEKV